MSVADSNVALSEQAEALIHSTAGSIGSVVAFAILYPLDNIRTRLQVQEKQSCEARGNSALLTREESGDLRVSPPSPETTCGGYVVVNGEALTPGVHDSGRPLCPRPLAAQQQSGREEHISSDRPSYSGTVDCIRQVVQREGWRGLYTGLSSGLWGIGLSSGIYFFWAHLFKAFVRRRTGKRSIDPVTDTVIACAAGAINVFCTLPIWVVNTRQKLEDKGIAGTCKHILEAEGLSGFFRGLIPSLILVANPAIQFVAYEQFIRLLTRRQRLAAGVTGTRAAVKLTPWEYFVLGAIAKALATIVTYPYQVVKSRLQASHSDQPENTWEITKTMLREEGASAFYRGMNAKFWHTILNSAFMFAVYEKLLRILMRLYKMAMVPRPR